MNDKINIEDSNIKDSEIKASDIEDSEIKDSRIEDSEIEDSYIQDSEIEDSEIIGQDIRYKKIISKDLIKQRKEKIIGSLKKKQLWVIGFLIIALILGIYIRSMPMHDHGGGTPGLWDITTDTWTLGPDLDPWLFTRYAKTIVEQELPEMDMMRNVPLGFDTSRETRLLPYMIAGTYYFFNIFGDYNINFAAAIFPVIMFALTIIAFFLFVREIFIRKSKQSITRANIIALISTFFMIVIPAFLSRTLAGIPEKESAGFFFMFLAFYLFLKAWKSENLKNSIIFGVLAGISTALMGLISGLVSYIFITIAIANLIAFMLNKIHKKEFIIYSLWLFTSFIFILILTNRYALKGMLTSLDSGLAFLVFLIFLIHFILWSTRLFKIRILKELKLPKNIISLIIAIILILILISIFLGPGFIIEKIKVINKILFKATSGRFNITVAENRQPFFTEWGASFGPFIKNIPIFFWLFFTGSVVLFKKMLNKLNKRESWILTGFYLLFLIGLIFSRYSASSIFNGENFISKAFYYACIILLIGSFVYYFTKYHKHNNLGFEKINYEFLFLFSFFVLCLITARGAVRLIMVLSTIVPVFVGFLVVESFQRFRKTEDEIWKMILGTIIILILILSIFSFYTFYKQIKSQSYNMIPSPYNQQWQKAMQWVREETPKNSVFGHWWDYGYWLQSIGERATVLDGGNTISFWNYYMGRLVLTGDNQDDALEFLYNHNTTHFLIDSSDIGKYGAFSSIGSNENYDRYSWMGPFILDASQTQETNNKTFFVYPGGLGVDEDIITNIDGQEVLLPSGSSAIGAIVLPTKNSLSEFEQPYVFAIYQGTQYQLYLRYLSISGKFVDFGSGIEACAFIFPRLEQTSQGLQVNPIGASIYLSPRLMRGMLAQIYILGDPLDNFHNFKLVHTEDSLVIQDLKRQGMDLPDFVYFHGIQGPIKIWEIEYTGKEQYREDYIDTDPSKYISWQL